MFDFDKQIDRRGTNSLKWNKYKDQDVIPLWVADTDFMAPQGVIDALQLRIAHGVFGYSRPSPRLIELIIERMQQRYGWKIEPEWLLFMPGVVPGLNFGIKAWCRPEQHVITPNPVYYPFLHAPEYNDRPVSLLPMQLVNDRWLPDFDIFEEHNLNRQNFSNYETLGMPKVLVVKENLEKINPSIDIKTYIKRFDVLTDFELISECDVVLDALDNPKIKLALAKACKDNNISFVHAAIAGMNGQFSSNSTLEHEYRNGSLGIEQVVGNPSFSVTFAASIQSAEVIKILLNIGEILEKNILITNLLENEFILV